MPAWLNPRTVGEMVRALMELAANTFPAEAPVPAEGGPTIIILPEAPAEYGLLNPVVQHTILAKESSI
jgi:hypothetical protein